MFAKDRNIEWFHWLERFEFGTSVNILKYLPILSAQAKTNQTKRFIKCLVSV